VMRLILQLRGQLRRQGAIRLDAKRTSEGATEA